MEAQSSTEHGTEGMAGHGLEGLNPLEMLNDAQLAMLDDDQLDNVLDSMLIRIVETLVEMSNSDNELQSELNSPDKSGFTLLHYASLYNLRSLLPVLLSRGANPDTPTLRGKLTPLHLACGAGNNAICELLVRHGCAVRVYDSFNLTPADHAANNGFDDIHSWLVEKSGGDVKKREMDRIAETNRERETKEVRKFGAIRGGDQSSDQKHLLQQAFSNLSLKDKLAINIFVKKQQEEQRKGVGARGGVNHVVGNKAANKHQKLVAKVIGKVTNCRDDTIVEGDDEDEEDKDNKEEQESGVEKGQGNNDAAQEPDSMSLKEENLEYFETGWNEMIGDTMSDKVSDNSVDVSSVFSETDREGLDIAMTLMNDDELQTLQVRKGRRSAGGKNALSQHDLATFFFSRARLHRI